MVYALAMLYKEKGFHVFVHVVFSKLYFSLISTDLTIS
jgi:hypothetical protein